MTNNSRTISTVQCPTTRSIIQAASRLILTSSTRIILTGVSIAIGTYLYLLLPGQFGLLIARIENISRDDRCPNLPVMPHQTFLQELRATIAAARSGQKIMQLEISLACSCAIKCLCSNTIEIVECTPHQQSFSILRKHKQHINSNCRLAVEGVTDPSHLPGCSHYHYFADHYPICCLNRSHLKS